MLRQSWQSLMLGVGIIRYHPVFTQFKHFFFVGAQAMRQIYVTTSGSRPKPEQCFLSWRLRWMPLPKERYGEPLNGCGSEVAGVTFFRLRLHSSSKIFESGSGYSSNL